MTVQLKDRARLPALEVVRIYRERIFPHLQRESSRLDEHKRALDYVRPGAPKERPKTLEEARKVILSQYDRTLREARDKAELFELRHKLIISEVEKHRQELHASLWKRVIGHAFPFGQYADVAKLEDLAVKVGKLRVEAIQELKMKERFFQDPARAKEIEGKARELFKQERQRERQIAKVEKGLSRVNRLMQIGLQVQRGARALGTEEMEVRRGVGGLLLPAKWDEFKTQARLALGQQREQNQKLQIGK